MQQEERRKKTWIRTNPSNFQSPRNLWTISTLFYPRTKCLHGSYQKKKKNFGNAKGKKEVKERGLSIILDGDAKDEEINDSLSPTNYTEGDDYCNEKAIKDSVEGGKIDVGVVFVEREVITILDVAKEPEVLLFSILFFV